MNERKWLSGRASPCQGEGRGFESRLPLQTHWRRTVNGGGYVFIRTSVKSVVLV